MWQYRYDALGRRISKESLANRRKTEFIWEGSRLLQEYTPNGVYSYVYTEQGSYEPLAQIFKANGATQSEVLYYHNDQIGIPRELTDAEGNIVWSGEYSGWGKLTNPNHACLKKGVHQPFRLQNQYADEETGLHYNFFRYYDPHSGRFTQQDPIGLEGGESLYLFGFNIQRWVDPLGLSGEAVLNPTGSPTLSIPNVKSAGRAGIIGVVLSIPGDTHHKEPLYYATYTRTHPLTGKVYCGRTHGRGDPNELVRRRGLQQKHLNAEGFSPPVLDKYSISLEAIRGREQQLIDFHGGAQSIGGTARNKINGVSDWNPNGPYYNWASTTEFGALPDNSPKRARLW